MARVLVTGGAGYVGSHMMKALTRAGHDAFAYDNLSTGNRDAVLYGNLIEGCMSDIALLRSTLKEWNIDAVMHFASSIEVGESVVSPRKYYENNVTNSLNLIHAMMDLKIPRLIFSSTAAVYGTPQQNSIGEDAVIQPINPYGRTKALIESVLNDYRQAYGFASTSLRYFNAAGADPEGELGERHEPETHLIPLIIQAAMGLQSKISIFGQDYDTPDGTCVRDYVHVTDLCDAHLLALNHLLEGGRGRSYNLGNGSGFSVSQVIDSVKRISGQEFLTEIAARRPGDPAVLVADATLATSELGWAPKFSHLDDIVSTAWNFYSRQN